MESSFAQFKPLTPASLARINSKQPETKPDDSKKTNKKTFLRKATEWLMEDSPPHELQQPPFLGVSRSASREFSIRSRRNSLAPQVDITIISKKKQEKEEKKPNSAFEAGKKLPPYLAGYFPKNLAGVPIEDIDSFYEDKKTFVVIASDKTIFRFSATDSFWLFSPLNPIRSIAIKIQVHPIFSAFILLAIVVNCIFMTGLANQIEGNAPEITFTVIYTIETLIKALSRGFILANYTYLRDIWNWLDICVLTLAYLMFVSTEIGNMTSIRTLRVLRALKSVTALPGLRLIVSALLVSIQRLRGAMVLSIFVLSIFSLIGLQIYKGELTKKCVLYTNETWITNTSSQEYYDWTHDPANWKRHADEVNNMTCSSNGGTCPEGYFCVENLHPNPNFGYTHFDHFGAALLCSFRLMTQDFWESLYQIVIRCNGQGHVLFFMLVIFFGSFYLINVILAIIAMAYGDCREAVAKEADEIRIQMERERERRQREMDKLLKEANSLHSSVAGLDDTPDGAEAEAASETETGIDAADEQTVLSNTGKSAETRFKQQKEKETGNTEDEQERSSVRSDACAYEDTVLLTLINKDLQRCLNQTISYSLPGSPTCRRRLSSHLRHALRRLGGGSATRAHQKSRLDSVNWPYADDSPIATPTDLTEFEIPPPQPQPPHQQQQQQQHHEPRASSVRSRHGNSRIRHRHTYAHGHSRKRQRSEELPAAKLNSAENLPSSPGCNSLGPLREYEREDEKAAAKLQNRRKNGKNSTHTPDLEAMNKRGSNFSFHSIPQVVVDAADDDAGRTQIQIEYECLPAPLSLTEQNNNNLLDEDEHGHGREREREHEHENEILSDGSSTDEPALHPRWRSSRRSSLQPSRCGSTRSHKSIVEELDRIKSKAEVTPQDLLQMRKLLNEATGSVASASMHEAEQIVDPEQLSSSVKLRDVVKQKLVYWLWDSWQCPSFWRSYVQRYVALFVLDPFVDLFITICIVTNTLFLALDHDGMTPEMDRFLRTGNYFFTAIFAIEAFLKLVALSPQIYFKDPWATFDFVIVVLSLVELPFEDMKGLSVLRTFRLLRVFKLAKSWTTLNTLLQIIAKALGALGNLSLVLLIIVFIFAVVGMQIFGENYKKNCHVFDSKCNSSAPDAVINEYLPRWNFIDFWHAFMVVFRVLCGEYIESMWDCMRVNDWYCLPFFIATMIIGNLVLLKLFLALLLSAFGGVSEKKREEEEDADANKLQEAIDRIKRFVTWLKINLKKTKKHVYKQLRSRKTTFDASTFNVDSALGDGKAQVVYVNTFAIPSVHSVRFNDANMSDSNHYLLRSMSGLDHIDCNGTHQRAGDSNGHSNGVPFLAVDNDSTYSDENDGAVGVSINPLREPEATEVDLVYYNLPDDCLPQCLALKLRPLEERCKDNIMFKSWWALRVNAYRVVVHKYFETFIILMIVCSSISLALEDKNLPSRPLLQEVLRYLDNIFNIIFFSEMILKWLAFGLSRYFTDAWCWVDFVCVAIACVSMIGDGGGSNKSAFKALRTLRALRPLRAVSRWESMRIVVNALIQAIPSILNVLLVCLVFWLIFSIIGVQFYSGKFYKCLYTNMSVNNRVPRGVVDTKNNCLTLAAQGEAVEWKNSDINFDNVPNAYLALLQVATFKGWMEIMADAVDIVGKDMQPSRENALLNYAFFVLFIIFGSFFTMNLFIGVIIDNFNMQKRRVGVSLEMFMTDDQKRYYKAMKRLSSKKPIKPVPRPQFKIGLILYNMVTNQMFDVVIIAVIMLNSIAMCVEHDGQSAEMSKALEFLNYVFTSVFTVEFLMKLIALRWHYFKNPWNVFDMLVIALSIAGSVSHEWIEDTLKISPTLIRIVRVFRVSRVLRLVKAAKGIRALLFSLMVSLPALFNIALLLFLVIFIYSIVGVSFFKDVRHTAGIDDMFNFETVPRAFILLFQITTSAGWNGVLAALANESDCDKSKDCGNKLVAIPYLVSFLLMTFLVIVNMYIAVILENFSQATEEVSTGLTQDDFDMYYEMWEDYDPKACGYIPFSQVHEFLDKLDEPLKIMKPNGFKVAILNIPICDGDMVNCVDLLDILTRHVLGTSEDIEIKPAGDVDKIKKNYHVISSTLLRYKEDRAARSVANWLRSLRSWKDKNPERFAHVVQMIRNKKSSAQADATTSILPN